MTMNDHPEPIPDPADNTLTAPASGALSVAVKFLALVAIVGLAAALLLPAVRSGREPARRNSCMNNLKQIGLALSNYESMHGAYPPAYTVDAEGRPLHSWRTLILPYMEQKALYEQIDLTKPWDDPANEQVRNTVLPIYQCPSNPDHDPEQEGFTTYLAVVTPDSVIRTAGSQKYDDLPSAAQTLLVIDAALSQATHWMSPVDADEQLLIGLDSESKLPHAGNIFLALFVDGHVSALSATTEAPVLRALISASADDNDALQDND
jgi:hypothetical protein